MEASKKVIHDIHEKKQAEPAGPEQVRLGDVFFSHSVACLVILDRNFNFIRVNAAYARACGRDIGEFAGHNHFDLYPSDAKAIFEEVVRSKRKFETFARPFTFPDQPERGVTYWDWTLVPVLDRRGEVEYLVFSLNDVTERQRALQELRESEEALRTIFEGALDGILVADTATRQFLAANAAICNMLGYRTREEILCIGVRDIHPEPDLPYAIEQFERLLRGEIQLAEDIPILRKDGSVFYADIKASPIRFGGRDSLLGVIRDVTERKRAELALSRQKDLYNALSQTNHVILRGTTREELFQSVCRIVVEQGHLLFAWVGLINEEDLYMRPAATYGNDAGYMAALHAAMSDRSIPKSGLSWLAVNSGQHTVANDFLTHPATALRQEDARRCGVRAFAAFPIRQSGEVIGVINVYANEPGYFTDDLLATLDEMALDVSFALDNLKHETERRRMEEGLRAAKEQFRGLVEQSIAGIYIIQDGRLVYVNPRAAEIFGYGSAEELMNHDASSVVAEEDRATVTEHIRRLFRGDTRSAALDFGALRRDGTVIQVGANAARATRDGRPAVIGLVQDISEKKRAEEAIRHYVVQLKTAFMSTVEVATTLSEMRDPYTAGHERRVAEIAIAIGAELGLDERRQEGLRVAGHLHDIGKITVPSEILSKPGRLSPIEYRLIQGHPQASYDVLKNVEFPWPVAQVALQHHERMDGSGYPQGLKGEAILLEARIMAAADVIEAMSSHRPYRPGLGIDMALAEIERGRGTAYDANVADACLRLFRDKGYRLRE